MPETAALRPFEPVPIEARSLSERLLGSAKPDLAATALKNALCENQPGRITADSVSRLLATYGVRGDEARVVHTRVWEDALVAFADDDFISEEESAYLIDLRRLLDIGEDTIVDAELRVLQPRFVRQVENGDWPRSTERG